MKWAGDTRIRLMGCTLHVRMPGFDADSWVRRYEELRGRGKNLLPVFERFGRYLLESVDRNFAAEGRPSRWAALSPRYAARKARQFPGKGILEATGQMRTGFWYTASAQTVKVGNKNRWWWIVHQQGTDNLFRRGIHLPRRVILLLQAQDKAVLTRWVRAYLRTGTV